MSAVDWGVALLAVGTVGGIIMWLGCGLLTLARRWRGDPRD